MNARDRGDKTSSAYVTSRVKRERATRVDIETRKDALFAIVASDHPCTVRNVYYRATMAGLVPKTDSGYMKVQRALAAMRLAGELPFEWIADNTRWMRKPKSYNSLEEALSQTAQLYRRNLWTDSLHRVEVWCESDSIAGVLYDVTAEWDVPLMPVRGFSSLTFAHSAAEAVRAAGKTTLIYYVGDQDPAGLDIEANLRRYLSEWAPGRHWWERIGVTWDQVLEFDLPGTPPKKPYGFPLAVEAEALPAPQLRLLLNDAIEQWVDPHQLDILRTVELEERQALWTMSGRPTARVALPPGES